MNKTTSVEQVQRFENEPGNGTRYVLYVTPLPGDFDGGTQADYSLVTLYQPWKTAYILRNSGYCTNDYISEKFGNGRDGHNVDVVEIANLIRSALNRD